MKKFLIFDTIYNDHYYDFLNYEELKINVNLKFDLLDDLGHKIVQVIMKEDLLDNFDNIGD